MKAMTLLGLAAVLVVGLIAAPIAADETTMSGTIVCAKCKLKKAGQSECQDVLLVKDDKGATAEYYVEKNAAAKKFGHTCSGEAPATVTGQVSEKDGVKWIVASKIERKS